MMCCNEQFSLHSELPLFSVSREDANVPALSGSLANVPAPLLGLWALPSCSGYYVYLAEDAAGSARSQIQPMLMAGQ